MLHTDDVKIKKGISDVVATGAARVTSKMQNWFFWHETKKKKLASEPMSIERDSNYWYCKMGCKTNPAIIAVVRNYKVTVFQKSKMCRTVHSPEFFV